MAAYEVVGFNPWSEERDAGDHPLTAGAFYVIMHQDVIQQDMTSHFAMRHDNGI